MNKKKFTVSLKKNIGGWALMLPGIALFMFFLWIPLAENLSLAFFYTKSFEITGWAGISNFLSIFKDTYFIAALQNTLMYTLYSLVIGFFLPIILALILNEVVHFKGLFRIALYIPNVVPGIAAALMWSFLLNKDPGGVVNSLITALGGEPSVFFDNSKLVIPLIIVTMTWKGAGATMLIYLAGLQNVDLTQYEAARLDGAGMWRRLWHITLPHLRPTIFMLFLLQIISVFQILYEPMVMASGSKPSISLMLLAFNLGYAENRVAESAALAIIVSTILILLTVLHQRLTRRLSEV